MFITFLLKHGHGTAKPGCESRNSLRKGNPQDQKRPPHDLARRQSANGRFRKTCVRSQKVEAISEKCSSVFNELVYESRIVASVSEKREAKPEKRALTCTNGHTKIDLLGSSSKMGHVSREHARVCEIEC